MRGICGRYFLISKLVDLSKRDMEKVEGTLLSIYELSHIFDLSVPTPIQLPSAILFPDTSVTHQLRLLWLLDVPGLEYENLVI